MCIIIHRVAQGRELDVNGVLFDATIRRPRTHAKLTHEDELLEDAEVILLFPTGAGVVQEEGKEVVCV